MRRPCLIAFGLVGACCALASAGMAQPSSSERPAPGVASWPTERVELLDGRTYHGLVESQDEAWIRLIQIQRPRDRPMYLVIRPIERASIKSMALLDQEQRARLRQAIDRFINRARIEAARMEAVPLQSAVHNGITRHVYHGQWFSLESTTDEETARRIVVRVEQVFTAYRQILPPRTTPRRPLRLVVFGSLEEHRAYLSRLGLPIGNRAAFLREENLVVAGNELARFAAERAAIRQRHQRLQQEIRELKAQLPARLEEISKQLRAQGKTHEEIVFLLNVQRRKFEEEIKQKEREIQRIERQNEEALKQVAGLMLARLYHEAFHAYLENYVYPHQACDVPHWLNEGLAMVFEGGMLEGDTLRLGAPDRGALGKLKTDIADGRALALERLLAADARDFLVPADAPAEDSSRYYYHAWGLVYYLTFERHLLGNPALDAYCAAGAANLPPVTRFEQLVGQPLVEFEEAWRRYILELK